MSMDKDRAYLQRLGVQQIQRFIKRKKIMDELVSRAALLLNHASLV